FGPPLPADHLARRRERNRLARTACTAGPVPWPLCPRHRAAPAGQATCFPSAKTFLELCAGRRALETRRRDAGIRDAPCQKRSPWRRAWTQASSRGRRTGELRQADQGPAEGTITPTALPGSK